MIKYLARNATDMLIGMGYGIALLIISTGLAGGLMYVVDNWPNR